MEEKSILEKEISEIVSEAEGIASGIKSDKHSQVRIVFNTILDARPEELPMVRSRLLYQAVREPAIKSMTEHLSREIETLGKKNKLSEEAKEKLQIFSEAVYCFVKSEKGVKKKK